VIYGDPRHPYTLGLLNSVPRLDEVAGTKLQVIEGLPPELIDMPERCTFAPRCMYVIDRCVNEYPPLAPVEEGHNSACFRSQELAEIGVRVS
jgi:oligopeptide/dipeptide ABC transporter ATP-binding protein